MNPLKGGEPTQVRPHSNPVTSVPAVALVIHGPPGITEVQGRPGQSSQPEVQKALLWANEGEAPTKGFPEACVFSIMVAL